jgi:hypothetical protein
MINRVMRITAGLGRKQHPWREIKREALFAVGKRVSTLQN